jgi:hypothetical protein
MAVDPSRPANPRRAPAQARSSAPEGTADLIDRILRDPKRTNNFIRILRNGAFAVAVVGCALLFGCAVLCTAIVALREAHYPALPALVPSGLIGGPCLTYCTIRLVKWVGRRRGPVGQHGGRVASGSKGQTRKQVPPAKKRIRRQRSRSRSGRRRLRRGP